MDLVLLLDTDPSALVPAQFLLNLAEFLNIAMLKQMQAQSGLDLSDPLSVENFPSVFALLAEYRRLDPLLLSRVSRFAPINAN